MSELDKRINAAYEVFSAAGSGEANFKNTVGIMLNGEQQLLAQRDDKIAKLKEMLNEAADTLIDNDDYTVQALNSIGHDLKREVAK